MTHTDTCPQCLARDNKPTGTRPHRNGVRANYRCHNRKCRHTWTTDWTR